MTLAGDLVKASRPHSNGKWSGARTQTDPGFNHDSIVRATSDKARCYKVQRDRPNV